MNQRKMFDDEIEEIVTKHNTHLEKVKKMHSDEKSKLEQQVSQMKENHVGDSLGGTIKDAARCLDQCKAIFHLCFSSEMVSEFLTTLIFSVSLLVLLLLSSKHSLSISCG